VSDTVDSSAAPAPGGTDDLDQAISDAQVALARKTKQAQLDELKAQLAAPTVIRRAQPDSATSLRSASVSAAAASGRVVATTAPQALPDGEDVVGQITRLSMQDLVDLGGGNDQRPDKPFGLVDLTLVRLITPTIDPYTQVTFRPVDRIKNSSDKQWLASLAQKRFKDKNADISARDVQKLRSIGQRVGVEYRDSGVLG
jgi:hypothetical protein